MCVFVYVPAEKCHACLEHASQQHLPGSPASAWSLLIHFVRVASVIHKFDFCHKIAFMQVRAMESG